MDAMILVESASRLGLTLALDGDRLNVTGRNTPEAAAIVKDLSAHKADVIRWMLIRSTTATEQIEVAAKYTLDEIIKFWVDVYLQGIRITCANDILLYEQVDPYRVNRTNTYGAFQTQPCDPSSALKHDVADRKAALIKFLSQKVPLELAHWWYHPLCLQYEAAPLAVMAAKCGVAVQLRPIAIGILPVVIPNQKPDVPKNYQLPNLAPILLNRGYGYNHDAYRVLAES